MLAHAAQLKWLCTKNAAMQAIAGVRQLAQNASWLAVLTNEGCRQSTGVLKLASGGAQGSLAVLGVMQKEHVHCCTGSCASDVTAKWHRAQPSAVHTPCFSPANAIVTVE